MAHEGEAGSGEARHTGEAGGGAELDLGLPRGGEALLARGGAEELGAGETRRRSELERGAEEAGALGTLARRGTIGGGVGARRSSSAWNRRGGGGDWVVKGKDGQGERTTEWAQRKGRTHERAETRIWQRHFHFVLFR